MELPSPLKTLYRHWEFHTGNPTSKKSASEILEHIKWFIAERLNIWKQKVSGALPPYTTDPILSKYRFCNIFREFDRQTIEFHTMLLPLRDNFPLWLLNMFYCRMVARPETVQRAGLLSFDESVNKKVYDALMATPRPRFGTPYVFPISTIHKSATPTRERFIAEYLPRVMHTIATEIATWEKASVYDGVERILPLFGYRLHFLWTEVLIDVAYQFPRYLDLYQRFPVGPGALPTMRAIDASTDPSLLVVQLSQYGVDTGITYKGTPLRLSAENWEGIGCEYRKYTNLKNGNGRKRLFQ